MKPLPTLLVWLLLLVLLAAELLVTQTAATRLLIPLIGLVMAAIVALTFMRLGSSRGLAPVFAAAGVFWLCVMLGLGSLDAFTRHDVGVVQASQVEHD
jgi:cytochrome c oxidase subunit 4